jgi:tetratricopeptide (TPR) repeat protein
MGFIAAKDYGCLPSGAMKCPNCGAEAEGKFCPDCGLRLATGQCASCEAKLEPGARFCTQCGVRVRSSASNSAGWYVAGAAVLALILVLLIPRFDQDPPAPTTTDAPFAGDGSGSPPPLSANMRENADRLFNRVMAARETGDTAEAKRFAPMAVMAYENSEPLDDDGLYHLSLLQIAAGNPAAALASARRLLEKLPTHLLALSAAADASLALNDAKAARQYYQTLLQSFESEQKKELPEYLDHAKILSRVQADAKTFLER